MYIRSLLGILSLFVLALIIGLTAFTLIFYSPYVFSKSSLLNYKDTGILLTDRNDTPFYSINHAREDKYVPLSQISDNVEKSIVSVEDNEFYHHHGFSGRGIVRSMVLNVQTKSFSYGGSTITQQLVKNTLLSSDKSLIRKYQELLLALLIEREFEKDEILEMYLNTVYFGEGAIGIEEAASMYFNKNANELTLSEGAYLAGIIKSPSLLSPYAGDVEKAKAVRKNVLEKMVRRGKITNDEYNSAIKQNLFFQKSYANNHEVAPHFSLLVEQKLKELYGADVVYEGLKVKTTLDIEWQKYAENLVKNVVDRNTGNGVSNGAAVVMNPRSGEILVLVGSKDWFNEQFGKVNMALSPRQPGSTFKPIVYSLAFERGLITPATVLIDAPKTFTTGTFCRSTTCRYTPKNFDGKFRGAVTVRRALANSLNIPSVEVMKKVGVENVLENVDNFGISTIEYDPSKYGLSLVLGAGEVSLLEMTDAFSTFANNGIRYDPVLILEIKNKFGRTIYENRERSQRVIDEQTAFLISSILSDNKARSEVFGSLLTTPFPAAVKTGTTENFRDAWTIGYTPTLVTGVWVGNNDRKPMLNISGSLAAAPIWKQLMNKFVLEFPYKDFSKPGGIIAVDFCGSSSSTSASLEYFIEGTQPTRRCISVPVQRKKTIIVRTEKKNDDKNVQIQIGGEGALPRDNSGPGNKNNDTKESDNNSESGGDNSGNN